MPYSHPQPIDRQSAWHTITHLLPGASAFALLAGYINSVALGFFHTPVSHMTGAVSHLGVDLADGRFADATNSLGIVLGFALGGVIAGLVVGARDLLPGRRYGGVLLLEAVSLFAAVPLLLAGHRFALPLVSMACGVQNAMTSSYCGLMIRSTHVTGTVTDIGVMIGHWIRHRRIVRWKLVFLCTVFFSFGLGGWVGALVDQRFGPASLLVPACAAACAGAGVWVASRKGWLKVPLVDRGQTPRTNAFPES